MCWTGPFEFRWLKGYIYNPSYYHQIGSIHLSHCCHIFPWLCVWDGCTTVFCHQLHIYNNWDFVSIICVQSIDVQSMVFANDRIHYGLQVVFVCLQITLSHYHHYADSSEGIELIKCFRYMLPSVCLRLRLFSQLSFIQYMGLCVFSLPNSSVMVVRTCTLSYYHHQIGSMNR